MKKKLIEKENEQKLYFVLESKGDMSFDLLRDTEKVKIECGIKHFDALGTDVSLRKVSSIQDVKDLVN